MGERLCCPRCGQAHHSPPRAGSYRCPRCGHLFATGVASRRRGHGLWLLAALLAIGLTGALIGARRQVAEPESPAAAEAARALRAEVYHYPPDEVLLDTLDDEAGSPASRKALIGAEAYFQRAWEAVAAEMPDPGEAAAERSFRGFLAREALLLEVERRLSQRRPPEVARGVALARQAFSRAGTAAQEIAARETLGRGLILAGDYAAAICVLRPLLPLHYPPRPALALRRAYLHQGLGLDDASMRLWLGNPFAFDETEARKPRYLAQSLEANLALCRRRPWDAAQHLRVGWRYYELAQARAADEPDFPAPGPEFGRRVSLYVAARYPDLIDRGIAHCRRAAHLALSPRQRALALEGIGHGYLMRRHFDDAIRVLESALRLGPPTAQAHDDLRQARLRRQDSPS